MTSLVTASAATAGAAPGYAWLLIGLPLLGAAILLLGGRRPHPGVDVLDLEKVVDPT